MITKNEIKKAVEKNLDFVKSAYESQGGFSPMFLVQSKLLDEPTITAVIAYGEEAVEHRFDLMYDAGIRFGIQKLKKEIDDIEAVFMMSEAWMSMGDVSKGDTAENMVRPSLDPKRIEVIISIGLTKNGDSAYEVYEIKKKWVGEKVNVEFENINNHPNLKEKKAKVKDSDVKIGTPLLDTFWEAVGLMDLFTKTLPQAFVPHIKELTVDELFTMFIAQINKLRK